MTDLHLHRWGDPSAPPLLMLHGFPEYGGAWAGVAAHLPERSCIAPDQRGYGLGPAPEGVEAYRIKHLVADIAALIEELGAPVPVVAHDWGAAVGYALAIRRPDLVSALVVVNGVHPGPFQRELAKGGAQSAASAYIDYLRDPGAEARLSAEDFAGLRRLFAAKMDMSWLTGPVLDAYLGQWSRPGVLTGMLNWYRASPLRVARPGEPLDLPEMPVEAGRVPVPHLVIWGEDDTALLPVCLEGLEAWCPDLTIHRLPGADHWICHQKPAEVAGIIREWLTFRGA
ncbi:alpha/beta fold hydrolase [Pararhodobacter sp.]|uniref:alpha/beta fold hydrolase n=1 Tax=Pararhodobacter sp. TaxID=2127056 RepID=UPI002FE20E82